MSSTELRRVDERRSVRQGASDLGAMAMRAMPTVILTSSWNPRDVAASYAAGASGYVVKPLELDDWTTMVATFDRYWRNVARVPLGSSFHTPLTAPPTISG